MLTLALIASTGRGAGQELPGQRPGSGAWPDRVLEKSDAVLASAGGSYDMDLKVTVAGGRRLEYKLRNYIKDSSAQRAIFQEPGFDRDNSAIRKGATAYFKFRAWPIYDAMNARSSFMDSPFSWEDALGPGLSGAYELAGIAWDGSLGERLLRCELKPLRPGAYRRIDIWLRPGSYQTVRRVYYTPSGSEWKTASYGGYVMEGGIASAWEMTMVDELTKASASISIGMRRSERMPDSFFEPKNRSKEK
jgi:hypothetical protein